MPGVGWAVNVVGIYAGSFGLRAFTWYFGPTDSVTTIVPLLPREIAAGLTTAWAVATLTALICAWTAHGTKTEAAARNGNVCLFIQSRTVFGRRKVPFETFCPLRRISSRCGEEEGTNAMTIGDVLAVTAGIGAVGVAWTAVILLFALAFPARAAAAQAKLTSAPGASFGIGLTAVLGGGLLALVCWNAPAGPVKLLAAVIAAGICLTAALGSAGAVRLLGERIDAAGTGLSPFAGLTRAAILYVLAGFLPVLGWFVILPCALLLSVGSGAAALAPIRVKQSARQAEIEAAA